MLKNGLGVVNVRFAAYCRCWPTEWSMRVAVCALALSSLATAAHGDMPPEWVPLPRAPSEREARCGFIQQDFWYVYTVVGGIAIEPYRGDRSRQDWLPLDVEGAAPECEGKRVVVSVSDGWLVACDGGEFGGSLSWIARDTGTSKLLCRANFPFLSPQEDGIIALAAATCAPRDGGRAYRVESAEDGDWELVEIADLGTAPTVVVRESRNSILVGTWTGVWRVNAERAEQLVSGYTWRPTSLVLHPDGTVYMGMSHFVLRFSIREPSDATWFAPRECAIFREGRQPWTCDCIPTSEDQPSGK
jgi:hypothetical protein